MTTKQSGDLASHLGLPINAIFGLIFAASVVAFSPLVLGNAPAPGSYVMMVVSVLMAIGGLALVFRSASVADLAASVRRRPWFWLFILVNFVTAGLGMYAFVGVLDSLFAGLGG